MLKEKTIDISINKIKMSFVIALKVSLVKFSYSLFRL